MNHEKLNLNLLQALDALLSEANVSRAAERLFISQSAMSNTLTQLREQFQDELLVRGPRGMLLTPKAESLKPELHRLMRELRALVNTEPSFDPSTSERIFRVGMSDVAEYLLLPKVLRLLEKQAPKVQILVAHVTHLTSHKQFKAAELELAVGCLVDDNPHLIKAPCFSFGGIVIARHDHPLMQKKLTMKEYLKAPQIRVQYQTGLGGTGIDRALEAHGKRRNVVISVPHVIPIPFMVQNTNLIASVPNIISQTLTKRLKLATQPLPIKIPIRDTYTTWLRQQDQDPGLMWLRSIIQIAADRAQKDLIENN